MYSNENAAEFSVLIAKHVTYKLIDTKYCYSYNIVLSAVKKGRYTHSKKAEAISQSKTYWKTQGQGQIQGHEQVQEVTSPTETDIINPVTSLSSLLSPETRRSAWLTSESPGMTSPSSVTTKYSNRSELTSSTSISSAISNTTESSTEDGVSSTDLDLVFDLQSDLSNTSPGNVATETESLPQVVSTSQTKERRHCSDNGNGVINTIQFITPDGRSGASAVSVGQEMSEIEKELLIETTLDLPPV